MTKIKCECGKKFDGVEGKEDTCPKCLKELINPTKKEYSIKIEFRFEAKDTIEGYQIADSIAEMAEQAIFLPARVEAKVGRIKRIK